MWAHVVAKVDKLIETTSENPMLLYCNNKSAISIAHNPTHHDQTKQIEVDWHFIKKKLEEGLIYMPYIVSSG